MPKRGGRKKFSTPEEIEAERLADEQRRLKREEKGLGEDEDSGESTSSEEEEEGEEKTSGLRSLITIENPNYVKKKEAVKLGDVDTQNAKVTLTRRQREEIEAVKEAQREQNALIKQEMERLTIHRQEREKEQAKLDAERKAKEEQKAKKAAELQAKMQQKQLNKQNKGRKMNPHKMAAALGDQKQGTAEGKSGPKKAAATKDEPADQISDEKPTSSVPSTTTGAKGPSTSSAASISIISEKKQTEEKVAWDDSDDDDDGVAFG